MKQRKEIKLLRFSLILFAFFTIVQGIIHLFFIELYIESSKAGPIAIGWIRWFGPVLICLGIGAIMVYRNPQKQGIFVNVLALGSLMCALTLLYSLFYDSEGIGIKTDTVSNVVANFVFSFLFWISSRQAKEILW